jgi:LuxR family transcriptional regulator, maltose regulon positive regulatory protein
MKVLHSKLLAPRIEGTITRRSCGKLRNEILGKRISTVVAGAGYGKTTFVVQAVAGIETVWYRLDETDRGLHVFLTYLVEGIRRFYPLFGDVPATSPEDEKLLGKDNQGLIVSFLHDMETLVDSELMIVLDDWHAVSDDHDIRDAMQFLVEHLPHRVHLVIISRNQVDLALSRLWVMGEVTVIGEQDLVFSPDEVVQLYEEVFGMSFPHEIIERIHAWTQGWVAGVMLFYHAVRGKGREYAVELFERLNGSARALFDYFEENVFSPLPDRIRNFLLRTSLMPRLNTALCDRFLKTDTSGDILRYLDENHLFTYSLDEEGQEYAYHHLFQEFLQSRANTVLGDAEAARLHTKLGVILEEQGMNEDAISHYLHARDFESAARLLSHHGVSIIWDGKWNLVRGFMEKMPLEMVSNTPWLMYTQAEIDLRMGKAQETAEGFQKAFHLFQNSGSQVGMDLCMFNMGVIYFQTGYFKKAQEQHLNMLDSPSLTPKIRIMLMSHLIFINALMGRIDLADSYYREALARAALIHDRKERDEAELWILVNYCTRLNESGEYRQTLLIGEDISIRAEKYDWFRVYIFNYSNMALASLQAGLFSQGVEYADAGLKIMREKGLQDHLKGWLLLGLSANSAGLKRIPEAIDYGKQSKEFFREQGSIWGEACACVFLQTIYMMVGDLASCEEISLHGLGLAKKLDSPQVRVQLRTGLAFLRALQGRPEEGESLVQEAASECPAAPMYQFWLTFARVCVAAAKGMKASAVDHLRSGLVICRENGFEPWLSNIYPMILIPLADLYETGEMREYLQSLFARVDADLKGILEWLAQNGEEDVSHACRLILGQLPQPAPPGLKVHCLGRFRIFQGDKEIPSRSWPSKKARMLFKLLVHYRPKGYVSKEVFMEHLWPEDDPQKTAKRFHVALATVRKVLANGGGREKAPSYVRSDGDTYLLDLGAGGTVDVDEFEASCAEAMKAGDAGLAVEHLLNASAVFQGDFLEEDLYESWCAEERDRLKEKYLSVLASITDFYRSGKDYPKAVEYCGRYLEKDPYAEDVYQQLMRIYGIMGNRVMVKKIHDRCRKNIVEGLGCPLSRETDELARKLLS